jgi:hypothetical protein
MLVKTDYAGKSILFLYNSFSSLKQTGAKKAYSMINFHDETCLKSLTDLKHCGRTGLRLSGRIALHF